MSDMEMTFIAEYLRQLEHDSIGDRAGRGRPLPAAPRRTDAGPRTRIGRWLIGVGETIAGQPPISRVPVNKVAGKNI